MTYLKTPPEGWQPPFCPNEKCKFHNQLMKQWRYKEFGKYYRESDNRKVQRYRCLSCERTFSTQTFSTTYWQKEPDIDAEIFTKTVNGMGNRQIARELNIDPATVDRKLARLGRHCLLFLMTMLEMAKPATEIVYDGLETFEYSQYFPYHHNLAVEKGTDFILFFNDSELRRKGAMTKKQKLRREELEKLYGTPDKKAIMKATEEMMSFTIDRQQSTTIYTDDHKQYVNPIAKYKDCVTHVVTPGKDHRNHNNYMWEINLVDMFLRHSSKNHTRETIAFSKRRQAAAERMAIFVVYRNFMLGRRQKDRNSPTPAMARGLLEAKLKTSDVLFGRIFVGHHELPESWENYYWRRVSTRALALERNHSLKYAS